MNAPVVEDRYHHWSKFLQGVLPHSFEQFRPTHMTHAGALNFFLLFSREIERVAQKDICIPLVARVAGHNRIESFGESNLLHGNEKRRVFDALLTILRKLAGGNCPREVLSRSYKAKQM